jgi:hypothetical protein
VAENRFDSLDVEKFEGESPPTCAIEALPAVLISQPKKTLSLSKSGPWECARQKFAGEAADGCTS